MPHFIMPPKLEPLLHLNLQAMCGMHPVQPQMLMSWSREWADLHAGQDLLAALLGHAGDAAQPRRPHALHPRHLRSPGSSAMLAVWLVPEC